MKKDTPFPVNKKQPPGWQSSSARRFTWKSVTNYGLVAVLALQVVALTFLVLFVCTPRLRSIFFSCEQQKESPYSIEETMIGGKLSARNLMNYVTGKQNSFQQINCSLLL